MSVKPPDYDNEEKNCWKESHKEIENEVSGADDEISSRLLARINTFVWRFGFSVKDVIRKIRNDSMFAAHFAKEPRRTGLHEIMAAEWIKELPQVKNFEILPKGGAGAIKITSDGNLDTTSKGKSLPGKSLDFKWETSNKTFYAMHKFTKESGGNQDSQYQEMLDLMKRFLHCDYEDIVLVVIVDGNFYKKNKNKRLNELKKFEKKVPPKSYALPIEKLPELLTEYYENY